jgi:hypothetical protein
MIDDPELEWTLHRELDEMRTAYQGGAEAALIDALALCREELRETALGWMLDAAYAKTVESFGRSAPGSRGRTASPSAKYTADMIHFERWSHVNYARDRQAAFNPKRKGEYTVTDRWRIGQLPEIDPGPRNIAAITGSSWDDAYEYASNLLRGSISQGDARMMKESYQKVQREVEAGSARYYAPRSRELLEILDPNHGAGIPTSNCLRPLSKGRRKKSGR